MKTSIITFVLVLFFVTISYTQDKEQPPVGGEPKNFIIPKKQVVSFPNGLRLVMVPYGSIPKVTIHISVKTGNIHEKEKEVWLSDLMSDLMEEGTDSLNSKQIANKMASMGGNLGIASGVHTITLNTSVLYEFGPDAIKLMASVLKNPAWPETEIDRLKNDLKRRLSVALTRSQTQARTSFYSTIYPDHPYGRLFPTTENIDSYSIENVKSFYNANIGAKRTTVYIAGKFDADKVKEAVEKAFGDWKEGPEGFYPEAKPISSPSVQIIDRPNAPQSTIIYGLPVVDPSHPDYTALDVTNSILGGSFASRITSNIREDKGYTYSPYSFVDNNFKSSIWAEMADVTTEFTSASLQEINNEIIKLQNEIPTEEELKGIQNYESGIFVLRNSTPNGIIGQMVFLEVHGLEEDYLTNRVKNINAVTPEKVKEIAKKYIRPEKMTLVIVGDKEKVEKQMKEAKNKVKD
ncbi:M16 family metallopeptidase [Ascidiimonas sp. W6]|uniref:M16 family metallopeptidase n=1 Tax=Ascidiimonas meishanensis TaxID=3128903 RepID=UPI0030EBB29C